MDKAQAERLLRQFESLDPEQQAAVSDLIEKLVATRPVPQNVIPLARQACQS